MLLLLRWLTGDTSQNLILCVSSFQDGLNDLSILCGCLFMVNNVRGGISKCIGNPPKTKAWQTFKTPQKTETAIFIYIYSSLAKF